MIKKIQTIEEKKNILEECKRLVLKNMKDSYSLIEYWDGEKTMVTPEKHFKNIIQWCKDNIYSTIWSNQKSSKMTFKTSYGAKHECERKLKCYVANNWMKLAMIYAGFEVCDSYCIEYKTDYVSKSPIDANEILTNHINFIVRKPKEYTGRIIYSCISDYYKELEYINN